MLKQRSTCPTRYPKSLAKLVRITPISLWFMVDISILSTGWWFGTFGLFSHSIGNFMIPTDFHSIIFQRGRAQPPTSLWPINQFIPGGVPPCAIFFLEGGIQGSPGRVIDLDQDCFPRKFEPCIEFVSVVNGTKIVMFQSIALSFLL